MNGSVNDNTALEHRAPTLKAYLNVWFTEQSFNKLKKLLSENNTEMRVIESNSVIRAFRAYLENQKNERIIPAEKAFYRARFVKPPYRTKGDSFVVRNPDGLLEHTAISGFDEGNSKEPSIGRSASQRASQQYASYLYLAEDKYTACSEIKTVQRSVISLARFQTLKDLRVVDFYSWDKNTGSYTEDMKETKYSVLIGLIAFAFSVPVIDEKEYYFTQYIADMIRKYGFDGIVYKSFYSSKQNYVIFNCAPNAIKFLDSELIIHYSQRNHFISVNDLADITIEDDELTEDTKRIIKQSLVSDFKHGH